MKACFCICQPLYLLQAYYCWVDSAFATNLFKNCGVEIGLFPKSERGKSLLIDMTLTSLLFIAFVLKGKQRVMTKLWLLHNNNFRYGCKERERNGASATTLRQQQGGSPVKGQTSGWSRVKTAAWEAVRWKASLEISLTILSAYFLFIDLLATGYRSRVYWW